MLETRNSRSEEYLHTYMYTQYGKSPRYITMKEFASSKVLGLKTLQRCIQNPVKHL